MVMYIDSNGNKHISRKHPDDCKCGCLAHREKIMKRKLGIKEDETLINKKDKQ